MTHRPTTLGLLTRLTVRIRASRARRREPWEPGMREWYAATTLDIRRFLGR